MPFNAILKAISRFPSLVVNKLNLAFSIFFGTFWSILAKYWLKLVKIEYIGGGNIIFSYFLSYSIKKSMENSFFKVLSTCPYITFTQCTGHVRFFLALLLADQWEAENPNFLVIWPIDNPSNWLTNERPKILTFLLFDLQTSMRGQNGVEFYQESTGHVRFFLALYWPTNERLKIVKPKSSAKAKSEIQVPNSSPKFKIRSPEEREWDWGWHCNPTGHPPTTHHQ